MSSMNCVAIRRLQSERLRVTMEMLHVQCFVTHSLASECFVTHSLSCECFVALSLASACRMDTPV